MSKNIIKFLKYGVGISVFYLTYTLEVEIIKRVIIWGEVWEEGVDYKFCRECYVMLGMF